MILLLHFYNLKSQWFQDNSTFNPRLARNVESENESTLKVKVGFSLFILLRPSQARVLIKSYKVEVSQMCDHISHMMTIK